MSNEHPIGTALNVLNEPLVPCSYDPLTGYFRDGCCETDETDSGTHIVCARVTQAFLDFSVAQGNDLVTPRPEWRFAGIKPGDRWCLCVTRWLQAFHAGVAPDVVLAATNLKSLEYVELSALQQHAFKST
jgi:hypothetical protein